MSSTNRTTLLLVIGLAAVLIVGGSGAFSAVSTDRTATINAAGDSNALLEITPHNQADPAHFAGGDTLNIRVGIGNLSIDPLFNITNRGTQPVAVWLIDHDYTGGSDTGNLDGDIIGDRDADNTGNITFYNSEFGGNSSCENGVKSIETQGNAVQLSPGDTLVVSMFSDTSNVPGDEADLLDELTINGDASVNGVTEPTGSC